MLPALLALTFVALMTSITATGILTVLVALAALARLTDRRVRERYRFPLLVPLALFAALTLASVAASADPVDALVRSRGLLSVALFFVAVNEFGSGAGIRRALPWLFAVTVVVAVYAMAQTWACTSGGALPAWVGPALKVKLDRCRETGIEPFRAKGFFSIYMTFGGSLLIVLSVLIATLASVPGRWRRLLPPATLALIALGLSYVRNAWVGLVAAVAVILALTRRWLLVAPLVAVVAAVLVVPSPVRTKALSMFDPSSPSVSERLYFWDAGWRMVKDAPFLGHGPGGVRARYPDYKHPAARRPGTSHLHNNVLQIAAERGLLGLAAWLAIWLTFVVRAGRIYRGLAPAAAEDRALVAGSLAAVVGFLIAGLAEYNFGDSEVIGLLWMVMAFPFVVAPDAS